MTNEIIAVADHPGRANWFHWLIQVLPQIKALADQGYTSVAVCAETPWQKETAQQVADHCGVTLVHRQRIEWLPSHGESPSPEVIAFLREVFLK